MLSVASQFCLLNAPGVLVMLLSPAQKTSAFSDRETDVHRGRDNLGHWLPQFPIRASYFQSSLRPIQFDKHLTYLQFRSEKTFHCFLVIIFKLCESTQTHIPLFKQNYENYSFKEVMFSTSKPRDYVLRDIIQDFGWGVLVVRQFFIPLVTFHQIWQLVLSPTLKVRNGHTHGERALCKATDLHSLQKTRHTHEGKIQ